MRVLVTGADGFSGGHLVKFLKEHTPHEVIQTTVNSEEPGVRCCDLRDPNAVYDLLDIVKPDRIYNMAGSFTQNFETDFSLNVQSVKNILEALLLLKLRARVLLVGSAAEYGAIQPGDNPVKETQLLNPLSVYGLTKAYQTHLMNYYCATHEMDIVMARTFNLLGKGLPANLFAGRLYRQIEAYMKGEKEIIEMGHLGNSRDYISVDEAVKAYVRIMDSGGTGEIYHVASGKPVVMRDLLERILKEESVPLNAVKEKAGENHGKFDVPSIYADISKLNSLNV